MPHVDLPQGRIAYEDRGPRDAPAVVFVHGYAVAGDLWRETADALVARGLRCVSPTLPLGAHSVPAGTTDLAPPRIAAMVAALLEALELDDVTLVGNDSGGAICQLVVDAHPERIGRLVLTNCDAFDRFPPPPFGGLLWLARARVLGPALRLARATRAMHALFGLLTARGFPREQVDAWLAPYLADRQVRRETDAFLARVDSADLVDAGARLHRFAGPVLLVWGADDVVFGTRDAHRLRDAFADARLVEVPGARTFLPHDAPDRLAELVEEHVRVAAPV
jgi:pimeloyl-ACP methyl ester carboxylesterase